jgi:hypothetical protein
MARFSIKRLSFNSSKSDVQDTPILIRKFKKSPWERLTKSLSDVKQTFHRIHKNSTSFQRRRRKHDWYSEETTPLYL